MELNHNKSLSRAIIDILQSFSDGDFNKYRANAMILYQIDYCDKRDEKIRKDKLEIEINAGIELNKN